MIILGLDPGTVRVGYGLIRKDANGFSFIKCGILSIRSAGKQERVLDLEREISLLIKKERPDLIGLEKLYFVKNQKTGMAVAEARGLLTFVILKHKIPLLEFTPLEVKRGLTGYGLAKKQAVERAVKKILRIKAIPGGDDAADALAVALVSGGTLQRQFPKIVLTAKGRARM